MKSGCKNYIFSREVKEKELKSWAGVASAAERKIAWKQRGDSPVLHQENRTVMMMMKNNLLQTSTENEKSRQMDERMDCVKFFKTVNTKNKIHIFRPQCNNFFIMQSKPNLPLSIFNDSLHR